MFIGHFQRPFSVGAELTVYVLKYLASYQCSLVPGCFVIPQFLSQIIRTASQAVGVEIVPGHR